MMMALHIWALSHGIASLFARGDAAGGDIQAATHEQRDRERLRQKHHREEQQERVEPRELIREVLDLVRLGAGDQLGGKGSAESAEGASRLINSPHSIKRQHLSITHYGMQESMDR